MADFNTLPEDIKLYILSHHKIHNLRRAAVLVNKEWNILVWQLLEQIYSSGTQEQFSQAFAVSIAQNDKRLFNLLKAITEATNTKFIIEPYLSIKDPVYCHNFMSTSTPPNSKGKERGFYFYLQSIDQKIYVLVVHNKYIQEALCVTDILHECNESKLLKYIKLPLAEDEKIDIDDANKKLTTVIKKNCKYKLEAYFDKIDVIKQWEDNACYTSRSLLYLAINRKDYGLASYLIDCIENYISQQNIVSMKDEESEPPKKKQKVYQEEKSDDTDSPILNMSYMVDIGYENSFEEVIITPATALLLAHNMDDEASELEKRLLRLGATVSVSECYWARSELYEGEGYYVWYPDETLLGVVLKEELKFRIEIYNEIKASREDFKQSNEKLKQELEKYKTELLTANARIQVLESILGEQSVLPGPNSEAKKRKRDIENISILTQFNSLTQCSGLDVADQSERLDIEEDNSFPVAKLFKS